MSEVPPADGAAARPKRPKWPSEPDPLREEPPADRFCDLVLNGGVASGVVYPWAMVELARRYRFRNIGGNSVGAMAAAMAAAAEYGRCTGVEDPFEPLRRFPQELAKERDGLPQMLRLFQPGASLQRLFAVFLLVVRAVEGARNMAPAARPRGHWGAVLLRLYGGSLPLAVAVTAALALLAAVAASSGVDLRWWLGLVVVAFSAVVGLLIVCLSAVRRDLVALENNDYGLCRGKSTGPDEALVEWLHRGIQVSAGRGEHEPPLTFAELWAAPRFGRPGPAPEAGGLQPPEVHIDLQLFASNITQGRPVRLPVNDANTRLFFHPDEWALLFPETVMRALLQASLPYAPASASDPDVQRRVRIRPGGDGRVREVPVDELRELPSGGMPIVVAARLSLCFPVLFTCVPVYAIDYETLEADRDLKRCLLSDGGLCSNFPVHLFDSACPRWPTFAFLLDKRLQRKQGGRVPDDEQQVWLPETNLAGRADNWQREVPGAELPKSAVPADGAGERRRRSLLTRLIGVAGGIFLTTKDWNDRVTGRLPTVRNRVVRLALKRGEGSLNIAMPGEKMLQMARDYGFDSAKQLIDQFAPEPDGSLKQGWRDHLYTRAIVELRALRAHLRGYGRGVHARADTLPLPELFAEVTTSSAGRRNGLVADPTPRPLAMAAHRVDPAGDPLQPDQRDALLRAVRAVETLEAELAECEARFGPYFPVLSPELRLRPPV